MPQDSLDATYFDTIYAGADDPWHFATSAYEARKYAATIEMISLDINDRALDRARTRCADRSNVRFELADATKTFPEGPFDLIVLSEVGYYWSDADLSLARARIASTGSRGTLALVHYLPKVDDYLRDGDAVHEAFLSDERFERRRAMREELYRIDILTIR
jgi:SAM-dependent methyltransferase